MDTVHRVAELGMTERLHFDPSNIMKAICYLTEHGHMKYAFFTIFIICINHNFNKLLYYSYQFPIIIELLKCRNIEEILGYLLKPFTESVNQTV